MIFLTGIFCISCTQTPSNFLETKDAYFGLTPPGIIPEIFAPGIVSDTSRAEHCQVAVSPKEDYVIFAAMHESGYGDIDLYISFKTLENNWGHPINMGPDKYRVKRTISNCFS